MASKAAMFFVTGFEEVEAIAPIDILRRGGVTVDLISLTDNLTVTSSHDIKITTDKLFNDISEWDYDMLILPGGPGTENYMEHEGLLYLLRDFDHAGKRIAAICAAPSILGRQGILNLKQATVYPGYEQYLRESNVVKKYVITDRNVTTAQSAGCALVFGYELLRVLEGDKAKEQVESKMIFH